jgi:hypothetical protein
MMLSADYLPLICKVRKALDEYQAAVRLGCEAKAAACCCNGGGVCRHERIGRQQKIDACVECHPTVNI